MKLDTNNPIPLYYQLQNDLKERIQNGEYSPGECIPAEKELQDYYGVSRVTVRNAVTALEKEGYLIKKQGFGTVVAPRRMVEKFSKLSSFTEKIESQGGTVTTSVLGRAVMPADARIAGKLELEVDTPVLVVKRLRFVDREPIALFTNYINSVTGLGIDDNFDGSIFKMIEERHSSPIRFGEKSIGAMIADESTAEKLGIAPGDPLLMIENLVFDQANTPLDFSEGVYRADRYQYVVHLER